MTLRLALRVATASALVLGISAFPGCASQAQQHAQDGVKALAACDMRTAHQDFSDAYALDSSDPSIALAFALSDVVLLPEDPALETLRPRFGFTKPFDTTFMWSKGGFMDLASQKTTTCNALGNLVRANVAHPSLDENNPLPFLDTLDKTLTFGDLRDAGVALGPRFDKLANAFATAAGAATDAGVDIQGGCGATDIVLQKPELYALAGTFALVEASFQLARVYDGSVRVWPVFMQIANENGAASELVADMNAAFLHVADASQAPAAQTLFAHAFDLFGSAITAARAVKTTPPNAVVDWLSFPPEILVDTQTIAQAAHDVWNAPTAIPLLSSTVTVDGPSITTSPVELAPLTPQAFAVDGSGYVTTTFDPIRDRLGARMNAESVHVGRRLHVELLRRRLACNRRTPRLVDADVRSRQTLHVDVRVPVM